MSRGRPLTPAELETVRRHLSRFDPTRVRPPEALQQRYLDFYGIDFAREFAGLEHQVCALNSGGYRLCLQVLTRPGAGKNLLLVHGYLDHVGLFGHLVRFGLERGYNVVAFDLPGHGLSTGEPAAIEDFADYSAAIADVVQACSHLSGGWQLIAQSTGAAALFDYLLKRGAAPFSRAVLLAPLIRPRGWRWIRAVLRLLQPFRKDVVRRFAGNSSDAEFLKFVRADPLQPKRLPLCWIEALRLWLGRLPARGCAPLPMLAIQGDADRTVDWRYNIERIQRIFAGTDTAILTGARHHLANESEFYRRQIVELMDEFL